MGGLISIIGAEGSRGVGPLDIHLVLLLVLFGAVVTSLLPRRRR